VEKHERGNCVLKIESVVLCRRIDKLRCVFVCKVECMWKNKMVKVAHSTRMRSVCVGVCVCVCVCVRLFACEWLLCSWFVDFSVYLVAI